MPQDPSERDGVSSAPAGLENSRDVAAYIARIARDLAAMARGANLNALGYVIEMVQLEADSLAQRSDEGGSFRR